MQDQVVCEFVHLSELELVKLLNVPKLSLFSLPLKNPKFPSNMNKIEEPPDIEKSEETFSMF